MPIYDKPFEPVRDPSAFRRYLQGCRVLGCCFVKPLSGAQPLRDRRWSPYSLYSVACLGVMWQLVLRSAAHYVARGNLDSSAYAVLGLLYLAQSSVTFVSMVVCAQRLLTMDALCDLLEARFPLPAKSKRRLSCFYRGLMLLQMVEAADQNGQRAVRYFGAASSGLEVLSAAVNLSGALITLFWSYIPQTGTVVVALLFAAASFGASSVYEFKVAAQCRVSSRADTITAGLAALKRDLRLVRHIVAAAEDAFQAGVLAAHLGYVARLCIAVYYVITNQFHVVSTYSYVMYVCYVVVHAIILSKSADGLTLQLNRLKRTLESAGYDRMLAPSVKKELQAFLLSLDPERYRLTVAGLFSLRPSSLAKVAGLVLTYTVLLLQTNMGFSARNC
ncbi:uncharacterized protein LOC144094440 [Amblyomma americanum]